MIDCNQCENLYLTEEAQKKLKPINGRVIPHQCLVYGVNIKHKGKQPLLPRPKWCTEFTKEKKDA